MEGKEQENEKYIKNLEYIDWFDKQICAVVDVLMEDLSEEIIIKKGYSVIGYNMLMRKYQRRYEDWMISLLCGMWATDDYERLKEKWREWSKKEGQVYALWRRNEWEKNKEKLRKN